MCAGLPGGTAISMMFLTKFVGLAGVAGDGHLVHVLGRGRGEHVGRGALGDLLASAELAPKLNFTVMPGWAASNCLPSVVNARSARTRPAP